MKFLSNILKRAAQPSSSGTALMPYMHLQKYFQLFVGGIHTLKENPPLSDLAIQVPGKFLTFYECEEGKDFSSAESSFTTTGEFNNGNGGHMYHGEYVTHGKDGGAMEYIYVALASSEPIENSTHRKFIPHFVYLGGRIPGDISREQPEAICSSFILSQSGFNGEKAFLINADQSSFSAVISALAYADMPFKAILSGKKVDADVMAAAFSVTDLQMRADKFYDTIDTRTPHTLPLTMKP